MYVEVVSAGRRHTLGECGIDELGWHIHWGITMGFGDTKQLVLKKKRWQMVFEKRLLDITCKVIYPSCFRVFLKHSAITAFHSDFVVLCSHSVFLGKQVLGIESRHVSVHGFNVSVHGGSKVDQRPRGHVSVHVSIHV